MNEHNECKDACRPAPPEGGRAGDRGAALITALLFLVLLTALGLASIMTSSTELLIARNDKLNKLALDHANAGVSIALAALDANAISYNVKVSNLTAAHDVTWHINEHGYTDRDGVTATLSLGDINFDTYVYYRREDILHYRDKDDGGTYTGGPDDPEIVGYSRDCGYSKGPVASITRALPVHVIESTGYVKSGDGVTLASAKVFSEVTKNTINVNARATFDANCIALTGSFRLEGASSCDGVEDNKPPYSSTCATPSTGGSYSDDYGDVPGVPAPETGVAPMSFEDHMGMTYDEYQDIARGNRQYFENYSGSWPYGDAEDKVEGSLFTGYQNAVVIKTNEQIIFNGGTNTGVLIVEGDVKFAGNFTWNGLVYIKGNLECGAGTTVIEGSLIVEGDAFGAGNLTVRYNCDVLEEIADKAFATKLINWRRNYEDAY